MDFSPDEHINFSRNLFQSGFGKQLLHSQNYTYLTVIRCFKIVFPNKNLHCFQGIKSNLGIEYNVYDLRNIYETFFKLLISELLNQLIIQIKSETIGYFIKFQVFILSA